MKGLPNTCHNYRMERFQIPIKPLLFENLDLFGPVCSLCLMSRRDSMMGRRILKNYLNN